MVSISKAGIWALGGGLALVALAGAPSTALAGLVQTINYSIQPGGSGFDDVSALGLNGAAVQSAGLPGEFHTLSITPPTRASAGSAYYATPQKVDLGFVTDFRFRIRDRSGTGSDGFTFIIQNSSVTALGISGGAMGYGTNLAYPEAGSGISNSLVVAFDTWDNSGSPLVPGPGTWPTIPGANIITVQTSRFGPSAPNTPSSLDSLGGIPNPSGAFNDGSTHRVRIAYIPGTMQVFYDNLSSAALTVPVNLANTLNLAGGENAWVGFTAGTGALINVERHEILDWQFSSTVPTPGAAGALAVGGLTLIRRRRAR